MNGKRFFALIAVLMISGCTIGLDRRGDITIIPALPTTIEIDPDEYYYQDGYYYSIRGDVWFYAQTREGPWIELPRSRYPREVHLRHHDDRSGQRDFQGRDDRRDNDARRQRDNDEHREHENEEHHKR